MRRVRLGLLLSEIGQANGVEVTGQEMGMLMQQAAQQYRAEDRQRFMEYIQNEPLAAAQLRAPLYEDKVVDFLFDKAEISERTVTKDELQAAIEAEDTAAPAAKPVKKAAAKKAKPVPSEAEGAKKAKPVPSEAEGAKKAEAAPAEEKPAKKAAPAKKEAASKAEEAPAKKAKSVPSEAKGAKKAPAKK